LVAAISGCTKNPPLAPAAVKPSLPPAAVTAPPKNPTSFACAQPGAAIEGDDVERKCVSYDDRASKGDASAPVIIVAFSDFQCPYCSRVLPTLDQLDKDYPGKIRLYFRHNPLPFHQDAALAAQAAVAAEKQGKFWKMHDVLFANQQKIKKDDLLRYAQEIGLDMTKFSADLESAETKQRVDRDLELAKNLGIQGTPNFLINGRPMRGAVPLQQFKKVVDDELVRAKKLADKGISAAQLYAALMKGESKGLGEPQAPEPPPQIPVGSEVYNLALGDAPQKGGKEPKIALIVFSEFQCPYCGRANGTLDELLKIYKDDIRIAFRHFPLAFHNDAKGAALAAIAAEEQGKFWEMHDRLFANQQDLQAESLATYARELGLDMARYGASIENPENKARVEAEIKLGTKFGVQGTPSFFMNGRAFAGAYPLESFKMAIDEEIKRVDALLAAGTPRRQLYASLTKDGLQKAAPKEEEARPGEPQPGQAYRIDIKGAPSKGAKDALVTIVAFSDFQCPFCARVGPTIDQLMEKYKDKLRVVWRNLPLAFHNHAKPAAIAAMAAHRQGKFWPMHDLLYRNQQNLTSEDIERHAKKIGLNMEKFKASIADEKIAKQVEADMALADKVGVRGTPAFFINGVFHPGARPYDVFAEWIDDELAKAQTLVKKGTPKAKVYEVIMKKAKAQVEKAGTTKAE
jgi:protein-disulfide isomerase